MNYVNFEVNTIGKFETKFKMDKSYLKFYHKFRIALKRKSDSVKDSTIRKRYLRFYQKCNSNFKQDVLTPILVSHYIYIGTKNHIKETRTTTVRRTFWKVTNYFNNMCKKYCRYLST